MRTDLPPEAFTKETLQEAFNWLQDQGEAVRATVHTPERLVSLYRKSQRINDAPVSSKKFVDDLKSLATSLDQFGSSPNTPSPVAVSQPAEFTQEPIPRGRFETYSHPTPPPAPEPAHRPMEMEQETVTETKTQQTSYAVTTHKQKTRASGVELDELTRQRVDTVKKRFNLSSDADALRVLVALGYEKFQQFP